MEGRINIQRDESTIQLHINYRGSVLARGDRDESARMRAGDRAPDVAHLMTAGGSRRLFDMMRGGRFTLLNFGPRLDEAVEAAPFDLRTLNVVDWPKLSDEIADREGDLVRLYGATDRTLLLVRPDGYVAAISDGGDRSVISDYFAALR